MSAFPGQTFRPMGTPADRLALRLGDEAHLVERAAMLQIRANLEDMCVRIDNIWRQPDVDFYATMGMPDPYTKIERPVPQNFFIGARPSLIGSSVDFWPSITTRAATARASSEQFDHFDVFDVQLDVEVLCKAGPIPQDRLHDQLGIDAEGEVNRQIQRLCAAVHMCIRLDPSLGAAIEPIQRPPVKSQGFPFALPGNTRERTGDYWVYCGKRLRYIAAVNSL